MVCSFVAGFESVEEGVTANHTNANTNSQACKLGPLGAIAYVTRCSKTDWNRRDSICPSSKCKAERFRNGTEEGEAPWTHHAWFVLSIDLVTSPTTNWADRAIHRGETVDRAWSSRAHIQARSTRVGRGERTLGDADERFRLDYLKIMARVRGILSLVLSQLRISIVSGDSFALSPVAPAGSRFSPSLAGITPFGSDHCWRK